MFDPVLPNGVAEAPKAEPNGPPEPLAAGAPGAAAPNGEPLPAGLLNIELELALPKGDCVVSAGFPNVLEEPNGLALFVLVAACPNGLEDAVLF